MDEVYDGFISYSHAADGPLVNQARRENGWAVSNPCLPGAHW